MGEHIKILTAPSEGLNRDVAILRAQLAKEAHTPVSTKRKQI